MFSVKGLVEFNCLTSLPSSYVCLKNPEDSILSEVETETETIPIIDFSRLT